MRTVSIGGPALAALALTLLGGCSTYMDAKRDSMAGGPQQRVLAAQDRQYTALQHNTALNQHLSDLEAERLSLSGAIMQSQNELARVEARLATHREATQKERLKAASLRRELQALQDEADRPTAADAAGKARDEARLRALQQREGQIRQQIEALQNAL